MNDDARVVPVMIGGAVVGALVGYLFFTERGRALRRQVEPALERFARELASFRGTVHRVVGLTAEGWDVLDAPRPTPPVH